MVCLGEVLVTHHGFQFHRGGLPGFIRPEVLADFFSPLRGESFDFRRGPLGSRLRMARASSPKVFDDTATDDRADPFGHPDEVTEHPFGVLRGLDRVPLKLELAAPARIIFPITRQAVILADDGLAHVPLDGFPGG